VDQGIHIQIVRCNHSINAAMTQPPAMDIEMPLACPCLGTATTVVKSWKGHETGQNRTTRTAIPHHWKL